MQKFIFARNAKVNPCIKEELFQIIDRAFKYLIKVFSCVIIFTCIVYIHIHNDSAYFISLAHKVLIYAIPCFLCGVIISNLMKERPGDADCSYVGLPMAQKYSGILYTSDVESSLKVLSVHEAGHALVAYILGFRFSAHITYESSYISTDGDPMTEEIVKSLILVSYAGIAAEGILLGKRVAGNYGKETSDLNIVRTYLENLVFMTRDDLSKCPDDPRVKEVVFHLAKEYFEEAQELVRENQKAALALATEFAKKQDWKYEEIEEIMMSEEIEIKTKL